MFMESLARFCENCGKSFTPHNHRQKYCDVDCRNKKYYNDNKERISEQKKNLGKIIRKS